MTPSSSTLTTTSLVPRRSKIRYWHFLVKNNQEMLTWRAFKTGNRAMTWYKGKPNWFTEDWILLGFNFYMLICRLHERTMFCKDNTMGSVVCPVLNKNCWYDWWHRYNIGLITIMVIRQPGKNGIQNSVILFKSQFTFVSIISLKEDKR